MTLEQDDLPRELAALQLPLITWEEDYRDRVNPTLITDLLRQSVPLLHFTRWRVIETGERVCAGRPSPRPGVD